jgi:predicted RNase H-like HicB family nuclease
VQQNYGKCEISVGDAAFGVPQLHCAVMRESKRVWLKRRLNSSQEADVMLKRFTVLIWEEEKWFVAQCMENNVASQGESLDEAMNNLREALSLYYENEQVPEFKQTYVTTLEVVL